MAPFFAATDSLGDFDAKKLEDGFSFFKAKVSLNNNLYN